MASTVFLIGLDVSTTGAKALLVDLQDNVVNSATTPLSLHPSPILKSVSWLVANL
jgi:sugar (pentulose or hexulose) kinase